MKEMKKKHFFVFVSLQCTVHWLRKGYAVTFGVKLEQNNEKGRPKSDKLKVRGSI